MLLPYTVGITSCSLIIDELIIILNRELQNFI